MGGGLSVEHPLPPNGVDLRAEVAAHQRSRVEQAMTRAGGDPGEAARLLRVSALELARLQAGPVRSTSAERAAAGTGRTGSRVNGSRQTGATPPPPPDDKVGRIERGVEVISSAAIRRLATDGFTERQIANRLGCNPFVVEKVLRMQAERSELRKCGPLPLTMPPEREP